MAKKILLMNKILNILFLIITLPVFSQNEDTIKPTKYFASDQIVYELNNNYWLNLPPKVRINNISLSSNIYLMFPIIGKFSNVSLALGLGVGSGSVRNNSLPVDSAGITRFYVIPDSIKYSHNKFVTTYLEAPLEIRFMTNPDYKNRSYKLTIGGKFGYLVGKHYKYNGYDYLSDTEEKIKFKIFRVKNLMPYRYGVYARIGYGKFALSGFYALSTLFEENKGPEVVPLTFGLTILLF